MAKEEFHACKNFIKEFVFVYLNGDFYSFRDFDLSCLANDSRFGCNNRGFDCDDTNLARAIYFLLWGKNFPDLTLPGIGTGKKYRGDTLNTYNTVFGAYLPEQHTSVGLLKSEAPKELQILSERFHVAYHTIGNLILLPNATEFEKKHTYTLNTYRGGVYKDYFDLFLQQLSTCLAENRGDSHLINLINRNDFFFSWLNRKGGLKYFRDVCMLEDYFINDEPKNIFIPYVYCLRKKKAWDESEKAYYIEGVKKYILTATSIIQKRSLRMINKLYEVCNE